MKKLAMVLMLVASPLLAQQGPPSGGRPGPARGDEMHGSDPVMGNFFSPEMIMQNQEAIHLTDEQRSAMQQEMQRTQQAAQQIQWRLQAAVERLSSAVKQDRADEGQVLAALDSVLASEREMKRTQITLLLRLKSRLTPEQQAFLRGRMPRGED